jgi:anti-anti-sigma factor
MNGDDSGRIQDIAAGAMSKTTLANTVFFDKDTEKAKKFVSDMGFELELVPMSRFLPKELNSLKGMSPEEQEKAMEIMRSVNYWVMTAKPGTVEEFACSEDNFKADVKLTDDTLNISLAGRLDTISSPGLLAAYRDAETKGKITSISIDMKELEYISSAGLRVLLIMRKAVKDEKSFSLINVSDNVKEIIETTGFDTIFC